MPNGTSFGVRGNPTRAGRTLPTTPFGAIYQITGTAGATSSFVRVTDNPAGDGGSFPGHTSSWEGLFSPRNFGRSEVEPLRHADSNAELNSNFFEQRFA